MTFKKIILIPLVAMLLAGCNSTPKELVYDTYDDSLYTARVDNEGYTIIDFFALNDFHGALENDTDGNMPGIGKLNTFLKTERDKNPGGTVLIANGDMWQGTADSNMTNGEIINHTLNHMGFAALNLGNHEFDWGIDRIISNKEHSNFPYLGANIVDKGTTNVVDFVDESPLIERDGVKIGIIGTMGSDLENTIQASLIKDIEFDVLTSYVVTESARLKEAGANIIALAAHDTWISNVTPDRHSLVEDGVVDVVFTGHQHALDEQNINGVPILQTRGRGRDVMHVQFGYNKLTEDLKVVDADVIEDIQDLELEKDKVSEDIYKYFYDTYGIGKIKNEVLGKLINRDMNEQSVANLVVEVMTKAYPETVGAFHNVNGGIRAQFKKGKLTYNHVYSAFPFDNELYIVTMSGNRLLALMQTSGNYAFHFNIDKADVNTSEMYKVVTISFLYEINGSPVSGLPYENMFTYPRDILADYIRTTKTIDGSKY